MKVAYLGPRGTFSDEALQKHPLTKEAEAVSYPTIPEVIMAAERGEVDYALVPTENSIEGGIQATLDMLVHRVDLQIYGEVILSIHHNLLAKKGVRFEDIEAIYSHPQPLGQCRDYLQNNFPGVPVYSTHSTSAAVDEVSKSEEKWAAIGTKTASKIYGLNILASSIQDVDDNNTRFLLLGQRDHEQTGNDKTSIAFGLEKDRPGGLASIMSIFSLLDINLTRIESRPSKRNLGEYIFFIDFLGHKNDIVIQKILNEIAEKTDFLKVLGSYPRYDASETVEGENLDDKSIAVLGLGMIGASLAGALKRHRVGKEVIGLDRGEKVIEQALARGIIDRGTTDFPSLIGEVDILIIATPVGIIGNVVKGLLPYLKEGCLITDVGSTKQNVVNEIEGFLPDTVRFLGGHPMTGSEKSGIQFSNSSIFAGAVYMLTPTEKTKLEDLHLLKKMAERIGSKPIIMPLDVHDRSVAAVSHLPHLMAVAMVLLLSDLSKDQPDIVDIAAGGFRDTTRVASGDPVMWRDIFLANKTALLDMIDRIDDLLQELRTEVEKGDPKAMHDILEKAKEMRDQIPICRKN